MSSIWSRLINLAGNVTGTLTVPNGGTGDTTLASNGVLYGNGVSAVNALAVNASATNKFLTQVSSGAPGWNTVASSDLPTATTGAAGAITLKSPTQQIFTSGSGTYTTPANTLWIRVRMAGGGGQGSGSGNSGTATAGGNGGDTTFGSSLLTAAKGTGGTFAGGNGGAGGSATINVPAIGIGLVGGTGRGGPTSSAGNQFLAGGSGGVNAFGGSAGAGGEDSNGGAGATNTGAGGTGGGTTSNGGTAFGGDGGGAGAFIDAIISGPSATYSYAVGAGGSGAGAAGTNGRTGGNGGSGIIIVEEHYY